MKTVFVSGRMHVLFNVREIVLDREADVRINSYSCKWCGWTAVVDEPAFIPDHECSGPPRDAAKPA
jgi:hypothetical protein